MKSLTSSLKIFSNKPFSGAAAPPDTAFKRTAKLERKRPILSMCEHTVQHSLRYGYLLVVIGVGDSRGAGPGLLLDTTGGDDLTAGVDGGEGEGSSEDRSASKQTKKQARHFSGSYLYVWRFTYVSMAVHVYRLIILKHPTSRVAEKSLENTYIYIYHFRYVWWDMEQDSLPQKATDHHSDSDKPLETMQFLHWSITSLPIDHALSK